MAGPSFAEKLRLLVTIARRDPSEAASRAAAPVRRAVDRVVGRGASYRVSSFVDAVNLLDAEVGAGFAAAVDDDLARACAAAIRSSVAAISRAPFDPAINASTDLGSLCYALVRAMRPTIVVETGVGYGVSSRFILTGLAENHHGVLHSIDLPPLGERADEAVGVLVPSHLRSRWILHRGSSRRLLAPLLRDLDRVDVFVHDSLHTYRNMRWELSEVFPFLGRPAAVIVDDIEPNRAFHGFVASSRPAVAPAIRDRDKQGLYGVAVFPPKAQ